MRISKAGVQWVDVWAWAQELRDERGLWVRFEIHPPSGIRGDAFGTVVLQASELVIGVGAQVRHTMWRRLPPPDRGRAEDLALQLIALLDKKLDRAEWSAERASQLPLDPLLF